MSEKRAVLTVDGLAGTGKTTLSKLLAKELGFVHMSTGMLYRTVGFLALREGVSRQDGKAFAVLLRDHEISLVLSSDRSAVVVLDGNEIWDELYTPQVSEATSEVAVHHSVREALISAQREAFLGEGLVAEGRDMGTVVFPEAVVKFWIETDIDIKVERRFSQMQEKEGALSPERAAELREEMRIEIHERDKRDQERGLAPSKKGEGMITIDNSRKSIEDVLAEMMSHIPDGMRGRIGNHV